MGLVFATCDLEGLRQLIKEREREEEVTYCKDGDEKEKDYDW